MSDDLAERLKAKQGLLDELEQALDALNEMERLLQSSMDKAAAARELMSRLAQLRHKVN